MKRTWRSRLGPSVLICLGGSAGIAAFCYACLLIGLHFAATGFLVLMIVAVLSLVGDILAAVILSIVAVACLNFFFVEPVFSFDVESLESGIAMLAFLTTSLIITGLTAKVRRMADEELRQTRLELARFARVSALGELTASIAHEVNQPLAGIVSSSNACLRWLASDPPNVERASQSATRIIRDANRASEVVQRVRDLIRNAPPAKARLDINEVIVEVTQLSREQVERQRILLRTQFADDAPQVWGDRIQLQQVLLNLIGNAIDAVRGVAAAPREVTIGTGTADSGEVLVSVSDSGPGLDTSKTQDIFNAFYTTKEDGMGMGLAISRSIVEAHGGRLWATANQPHGARFQFTLPAAQDAVA
jgi:C4-dicarboxylate-specific signal transduction histidine kinase